MKSFFAAMDAILCRKSAKTWEFLITTFWPFPNLEACIAGSAKRKLSIAASDKAIFYGCRSPTSAHPGSQVLSHPYGIASTSDGTVWYSESGIKPNTVVAFNPNRSRFSRGPSPRAAESCARWSPPPTTILYLACSGVNKKLP